MVMLLRKHRYCAKQKGKRQQCEAVSSHHPLQHCGFDEVHRTKTIRVAAQLYRLM